MVLDLGPISLQGAPAEDWVFIGGSWTLRKSSVGCAGLVFMARKPDTRQVDGLLREARKPDKATSHRQVNGTRGSPLSLAGAKFYPTGCVPGCRYRDTVVFNPRPTDLSPDDLTPLISLTLRFQWRVVTTD